MSDMMTREEQVEAMTEAIITAALWVGLLFSGEDEEPIPLDEKYSKDDLAPGTVKQIAKRAERFIETYLEPVSACVKFWTDRGFSETESWGQIGHDYLMTCEGYGTGFWDRGMGALGEELTIAAASEPELALYPWDDNLLYV